MSDAPVAIYAQLGHLLANRPDLAGAGHYGDEQFQWLGRVSALVEQVCDLNDRVGVQAAISQLLAFGTRRTGLARLMVILHRALALAEAASPVPMQGAFIDVGQPFSAFQAINKAISSARTGVLIVDPYLDASVFDFLLALEEGVSIRLLSDSQYQRLTAQLKAGVDRWREQFGSQRPVDARATAPKALHDRLIITDESTAWSLTQSFKDMAERSPASLIRVDEGTAALKRKAYSEIWADSRSL